MSRIKEIQKLPDEDRKTVYSMVDAYVRDYYARRTYHKTTFE